MMMESRPSESYRQHSFYNIYKTGQLIYIKHHLNQS